ncbi:MAG: chloride channel protein [Gemmatimonadales bacterium]
MAGAPLPDHDNRQRRLLFDTVALGVIGAVGAQLFNALLNGSTRIFLGKIAGYVAPGLPNEGGAPSEVIGPHGLWLVPVVMVIGGLIVGVLVERLAPEAEGHGTDAVIKAFHRNDGRMRARVPFVKLVASAITIGSGGSAGREGPMALITGGIGSWYASFTHRDRDRRLLLLVGMSAGLSAIFRSPIGAALLSVEILYAEMEFEPNALLYTTIGAIVAYAVNGMFVGFQPLFRVSSLVGQLPGPLSYLWYLVLGVAAGLVATVLPLVFYGARDFFRSLPIPAWLRPAVGALLTGAIALVFPKVIAGGYGWMQQAIDGNLALSVLAVLVIAKMVAMSFTVGSGGSGGVFAPTLFIGAMLGGACAAVFHQPPAPFVIVAMAAVFAGAAHVPIATMMMVTEMTGGYTLLVPATLAVVISYLVQMRLSARLSYRSVYEAQVANRGDSPAHHEKHLEIALKILREKGMQGGAPDSPDALVSLLRSGAAVELPGDRRLAVGVLRADSPFVGKTIGESKELLEADHMTVVAVIRGEHMLAPRPDLVFTAGDRLLLVAAAGQLVHAWRHVSPW